MFSNTILFFGAVVALANAEVPSYIQVCGARNPKLNECILSSVAALGDKLLKGIPELDIPSSDPLTIDKVVLIDTPNFKATGTDIKLYWLGKYQVKMLHVDLEKHEFDMELFLDQVKLEAMYDVSAKILVPIKGSGPIKINAKDVTVKVKATYKLVDRGGKKYAYFSSVKTQLSLKKYTVDFEANNLDKTLQEAVTQALGHSHEEIMEAVRPNLEKAIAERCLTFANNIFKHFTYDELFPDRE
ncbi:putative beta-carotene-binding protein [Andrena cerasifolii]|uniref:putative beta-carotene-binding protein n=1 Tax=Andrena cerasifolii TaxID=2819439 RepID=UPI004037E6ED